MAEVRKMLTCCAQEVGTKRGYKSAHMTKQPSYQHIRKVVMALWQMSWYKLLLCS